jgi:hypothetical protein
MDIVQGRKDQKMKASLEGLKFKKSDLETGTTPGNDNQTK